jgi:hypothetical protein
MTRWTLRVFTPESRESASLQARPRARRQVEQAPSVAHNEAEAATTKTASVEPDAPQASVLKVSDNSVASPDSASKTKPQSQAMESGLHAPALGFSRNGINPFVFLLLSDVGGATNAVQADDSASDSGTAMNQSFGTSADTKNTLKPTLRPGSFSDEVTDITAGPGSLTFSGGGVADQPQILGLPLDSVSQPESSHAGSSHTGPAVETASAVAGVPAGALEGGPLGSHGLGETSAAGVDLTALPAGVVVGLVTPETPGELGAFVSAYYGSVANAAGPGVSSGLELSDASGVDEVLVNPEPGTLVLFGSGLIALTQWARKANRRRPIR